MPPRRKSKSDFRLLYKRLAVLFLSEAEDDDDDFLGVLFLSMAKQHATVPRGPYDRVKSVDFCQKLLFEYTDRWFKAHLRYVKQSTNLVHYALTNFKQDDT